MDIAIIYDIDFQSEMSEENTQQVHTFTVLLSIAVVNNMINY